MDDDISTEPAMVLIRYANLFGALVVVLATEHPGYRELRWSCAGCMDGRLATDLSKARQAANGHATNCRALPPDGTAAPHTIERTAHS